MSLERELYKRADNKCELCAADEHLQLYTLAPHRDIDVNKTLVACKTCVGQIDVPDSTDSNHWRCLNDSMWSEHQAVQVAAWRMLSRLRSEGWPQDLLDMMYLDVDALEWAKALGDGVEEAVKVIHRDVNGVILEAGDSVVLVKDLKVKGSSIVAKQGVAVRRISLDHENANYIEGKIDGQHIVIITKYVKKL